MFHAITAHRRHAIQNIFNHGIFEREVALIDIFATPDEILMSLHDYSTTKCHETSNNIHENNEIEI